MTSAAATAALLVVAVCVARWLPAPRGLGTPARHRGLRLRPASTDELCEALDQMAAEVRTGSSLTTAVRRVAGTRTPVLASVGPTLDLPLTAPRQAPPDVGVVVHAINAAHALGGHVAATLDHAAAMLRERSALRAEVRAHAAQARLSARVLTAVPLVFAGWSAASSSSFRDALVHPVGTVSACLGGVLNVAGWYWMRAVVGRATR